MVFMNRKKAKKAILLDRGKMSLSFPHIKASLVIATIAVGMLLLAYVMNQQGVSFWSSMFANICAGLFTGLVLCFVGGLKQRRIAVVQVRKEWLETLAGMLKVYFEEYHKLRKLKFTKYSEADDTLFNFIYDVGVHASDVNSMILQSTFDRTIAFNPCGYCKERFGYDAVALAEEFDVLHDKLYMIDIDQPSSSEIVGYFSSVHSNLRELKGGIFSEISKLNVELAEIQKTII